MAPGKTVKTIKDLAARGFSARQIARHVGVSRQRIYHLAGEHGVSLPHPTAGLTLTGLKRIRRARGATSAKARILTGGVDVPLSHNVAGMISELLVAADLMARDFRVYLPIKANRGHDLVAESWDGCLLTFEVRSAHRTLDGGISWTRNTEDRANFYALVVTGEPVMYKPDLSPNFPPNDFSNLTTIKRKEGR